jgi:aspartate aminotransferase
MKLSKRAANIKSSITLEITAKAKKMQDQGLNVIGFGAGEPDFDTPDNIKKAGIEAIERGLTRYTAASGTDQLKDSVIWKFKNENGLEYDRSQILISCGAKHSLHNCIQALIEEGDEVIITTPYWVSYPDLVELSGGTPVFINTEESNGFKAKIEDLKKATTNKTKMFILNSPSNPTGAVYSIEELQEIAKWAVDSDIVILSDEIYEKLIYDGEKHHSIASINKDIYERTIVINGVSKAYAMTGWRIGYAAGPKDIIKAMSNIQSHATSNPTTMCQHASIEAIKGDQKQVELMVKEFDKRRIAMMDMINSIPGMSCVKPKGAFYVMANISKLKGQKVGDVVIEDSAHLCQMLLEKAQVACVPGSGFGDDDFMRLSYATSMDNIVEGLKRIKSILE